MMMTALLAKVSHLSRKR